jgi:hypothetical protein
VDARVRRLIKAGRKKVFHEVASGAKTDRAQLRRLLGQFGGGDVVKVTRDRAAGALDARCANTSAAIADRKARFRSLGGTWADITRRTGG